MSFPTPPGFPVRGGINGGYTGLGAAGGARGTGAGAIRALVEFAFSYNRGNLEQIAGDLQKLQAAQVENQKQLTASLTKQQGYTDQIAQGEAVRATLNRKQVDAYLLMQKAQANLVRDAGTYGRASAIVTRQAIDTENAFNRISGLTNEQNAALRLQAANQQRIAAIAAETNGLESEKSSLIEQQNVLLQEQSRLGQAGAKLTSRLGGLGLGLLGGVVGGALVSGLILGPLQGVMDKVTEAIQGVIDPSKKARAAVDDLGKSINGMVDDNTLTRLGAAQKFIEGIQPKAGQQYFSTGPLALAAQSDALKTYIDELQKYLDLGGTAGVQALINQQTADLANKLASAAQQAGTLHTVLSSVSSEGDYLGGATTQIVDFNYYLTQAKNILAGIDPSAITGVGNAAGDATSNINTAADAAARLREELLNTSINDSLNASISSLQATSEQTIGFIQKVTDSAISIITYNAQQSVNDIQAGADAKIAGLQKRLAGLQLIPSARTNSLQRQLDGLSNAGPSDRTQRLTVLVDKLNKAQERQQYQAQLADIAEQRHLILLQRRLELSGKAIDLDKYQGKDRVTAIDALLSRMQKQNKAQSDFNSLLKIEYQISQGVSRNVGESIQAFIERRAQYNNDLLAQAAGIRSGQKTDQLQAEKARLTTLQQLHDLAAKRQELIDARAHALFMKRLQQRLQASQKADQAALAAKRKYLQAELDASKKADQAALDHQKQAITDHIVRVKAQAQSDIAAINATRDHDIAAQQASADAAIATEKQRNADAITAERAKYATILQLANQSEVDRRTLALNAAKSNIEVEQFAGAAGGSAYAYALLLAQIKGLGLDPAQTALLLANANQLRADSLKNLARLSNNGDRTPGSHAKGGVFPITNSMNFGKDIRGGEEGKEIGVILSHRVAAALDKQRGGGPMFGDIHINASTDPHRDRFMFERTIRDIVRNELRN